MNGCTTNRRELHLPVAALIGLILISTFCLATDARAAKKKGAAKISKEGLQAAVVNYTERFLATVGQAAFEFEQALPTQQARVISARRKVYTLSAAATIAAGPNPAVAMLDMVVLATLNRMVWEDHWRPNVFGAPAGIMVDAFRKTEDDIFAIAATLLSPQQMIELRELIEDWHAENPEQYAVDFIRFSDFGKLGRKPELKKIKAPGGLLAPVKQAVQAADEIRLMSERAMFLLTKMQLIMGLQVELIYKELVMQPEVREMMGHVDDFKQRIDDLPDQIATERHAALDQISVLLAKERKAALGKISSMVARERKALLKAFDQRESKLRAILTEVQATMSKADDLMAGVQQTMASTERLIDGTQTTGTVFNELIQSVDQLAARLNLDKPKPDSKPFDINEYLPALEKLNRTIREASVLVGQVDQASAPLVERMVREFNSAAEKRVDHAFERLLLLFGFVGLMGMAIVVLHHVLKNRVRPGAK